MDPEFELLALKVLHGEADAEETALLRRVVAEDPRKKEQWEELREAMKIARAVVPAAEALRADREKLPLYRMQELKAAVRKEFSGQSQASEEAGGFPLIWLFRPGVIFALACLVLVGFPLIQSVWIGTGPVEFGAYADYTVRGEQDKLPSGVRIRTFENEREFARWQKSGWLTHAKAHIWFDEEHDVMHVLHPGGLFSPPLEVTYPLPDDPAGREELLKRVLAALRAGQSVVF